MRFPGFEGEWEKSKLIKFIEVISGIPLQSDEISENEYRTPILRGVNVTEGFIRHNEEIDRFYPKLLTSKMQKYVLKEDDLVIGMDGSKVGKNVSLISKFDVGAILIQRVARIRTTDKADINYIFQRIFSPEFRNYVDVVNTSSGIPHISLQQIKDFETGFPNILEQKKIAKILTLIDERIRTQSKIIEQLETLILGFQEKLFRQVFKLRNEWGNSFPIWKYKNGGELFDNISNKNHNSDLPILAITQGQGAIPRDLIDYQISVTDRSIESYKVVEMGDFIISLRSFQGGIEYSNYKGICSPAYIILRNKIDINPIFYKYYLKTPDYIKELNKKLEGIRDGKMISYAYFSEIPLPLPSLEEQKLITDILSSVDEKIENEKQILLQLKNQKKFLLQQMFI